MQYLVGMRLVESGRSTPPAEGLLFIEQYVLPTLGLCERLEREGRIVAGGPVSGAASLSFIIRADSAPEIDELMEGLPMASNGDYRHPAHDVAASRPGSPASTGAPPERQDAWRA